MTIAKKVLTPWRAASGDSAVACEGSAVAARGITLFLLN